jgi:ABC-type proline/glycine betaine transport system permease subunit
LFRRVLHGVDREIRTDDLAIVAVDAVVRALRLGRVIALGVESDRKDKDILGAILDAIAAAFAAVLDDVHDSPCYTNLFDIQRRTPVSHAG